jgi:hypothetical protein
MDLATEAFIDDQGEIEHLRECEECQDLLRIFVRQHRAARGPIGPPRKAGTVSRKA